MLMCQPRCHKLGHEWREQYNTRKPFEAYHQQTQKYIRQITIVNKG